MGYQMISYQKNGANMYELKLDFRWFTTKKISDQNKGRVHTYVGIENKIENWADN